MKPTVAVVDIDSFANAIDIIGNIEHLKKPSKQVVIKVGVYDPKSSNCTTPKIIDAITSYFESASKILIAESDSSVGLGLERLKIWNDCYNDMVVPFNLSDDDKTGVVEVMGEKVPFSHVLLEPNMFISTHIPRRYKDAGKSMAMNLGSVIKNLLGLILDKKKVRFHKQLPAALLDMYEAAGGIDLAVIDGTNVYLGYKKKRITVSPNILIVGTDAFATEAVGMHLVGFNPLENPVLQGAKDRGLGEIDLAKINIVGDIETPRKMVLKEVESLFQ